MRLAQFDGAIMVLSVKKKTHEHRMLTFKQGSNNTARCSTGSPRTGGRSLLLVS